MGVNFGDAPGVLDVLNPNGTVAASFSKTKQSSWTLAWSHNSITLNIDPSITAGLAPGLYNVAARVSARFGGDPLGGDDKGQQTYSNIVPFSFTVK